MHRFLCKETANIYIYIYIYIYERTKFIMNKRRKQHINDVQFDRTKNVIAKHVGESGKE